jgi:hypothetical protein
MFTGIVLASLPECDMHEKEVTSNSWCGSSPLQSSLFPTD